MGNANMFLRRFASRVATAFPGVAKGAVVTGLPVRAGIIRAARAKYDSSGPIVVMGGSQGAQLLSRVVPEALSKMKKRPRVFHQARPEDMAEVREFYGSLGIGAAVEGFFPDAAGLLAKCSVFIGRAGANTVFEVGTVGRPAVFVPIEHKDQQQVLNARKIADNGGAVLLRERDFGPDLLAAVLDGMLSEPKKLEKMAIRAKIFGNVNAAAKIADLVEEK
jgi:UDP-N-acetylglucosamine--N-acetylmuramyl-(pentapeptide) pyrophosphoryl-undecaprenol N-acetylglucosamine transferase